MDRLVFTSNATIKEQATARQVLVNDLANVSTVGFKSSYDVALKTIKVEGAVFYYRFQAKAMPRADCSSAQRGCRIHTPW